MGIIVFIVTFIVSYLFLIVPTIRCVKVLGKNGLVPTFLYLLFKLMLIIASFYFIYKVLPQYVAFFCRCFFGGFYRCVL